MKPNTPEREKETRVISRIAWGAIIGGLLVSVTMFMLIGSLALALSHSLYSPALDQVPLWIFALSVSSMFFGGFTASYLSRGERTGEAFLQGIILWGATASFLLYLAVNGVSLSGSEVLLGFPDGVFSHESVAAAWLAFAGVSISLVATVLGSIVATYLHTRRLSKFHGKRVSINSEEGTYSATVTI